MNERSDPIAAATRPPAGRAAALPHGLQLGLRAFLLVLACGFAHAQDRLADLVVVDSRKFLQHADPVVRGEAALVVASAPPFGVQSELLALAIDPEPAARQRALIALGLLGTPAAVQFLGNVLTDTGTRGAADGTAAAFGLGLVPSDRTTTVVTQLLSAIAQSSWKRQRDTLLALLLAMERQTQRPETSALRRLFDDDSNRDPLVRGQLLRLLLPNDPSFEDKQLRKLLDRGSDPERTALLQWLARDGRGLDGDWLAALSQLAGNGDTAELRTAALAVLTRARHLPALDLAVRALRDGTPGECAQAMRSLLAIGGAGMLRAAAPRIAQERDPARQAAMLAGFDAPLPNELASTCAKLAAETSQPWPLRSAAALALARRDGDRAAALLRDAFRGTTDDAALPALAMALRRTHEPPVDLQRLLDGGADLRPHPSRWVALLTAEHPEARRQVLAGLQAAARPEVSPLPALRAFRTALVLAAPGGRPDTVPQLLRDLLGSR